MILVPVCDDECAKAFGILLKVTHIGNDHVDSGHFFVGKRKPAVDNDNVLVVFKYGHVFPISPSPPSGMIFSWGAVDFLAKFFSFRCTAKQDAEITVRASITRRVRRNEHFAAAAKNAVRRNCSVVLCESPSCAKTMKIVRVIDCSECRANFGCLFLNKRAASFSRQLKSVRQDVLLPLPTSYKVHQSAAFFGSFFRKFASRFVI